MAIYIPHRGRFIAVQTANEPDPLDVCPGECWACSDSGCPRDTRFMEDIADAWMLRDLLGRATG